jgi:hypothetical protein
MMAAMKILRIPEHLSGRLANIVVFAALFTCIAIFPSGCAGTANGESALGKPLHGLTKPVILKLVTFNLKDTPVVGADRPERMRAIAAKLCTLDPDIVGFQESFIEKDRNILIEKLKKGSRLQYHQYYPSRVAGSGLLISSAFPHHGAVLPSF